VANELLEGLSDLGHRIECFLPGVERDVPPRLTDRDNLLFRWGTSQWRWNRWYSKTKLVAFVSGLLARTLASLRLRREVSRRHRADAFDVVFQFSSIEKVAAPRRLAGAVPLVMFPTTHMAGELRWLLAERRLAWRCQPRRSFFAVAAIRVLRTFVQRRAIHSASLVICKSRVFREHLISDYAVAREDTIVIPDAVRLERFAELERKPAHPPIVLVLGRVAMRKGVEDVVSVAHALLERGIDARIRVVGGPDLSSDYTRLLDELPAENAEYARRILPPKIPGELARASVLLQASKYEPFGLTAAEALAAGVPVVATSQVGAVEDVDRAVVAEVEPGDVDAMVRGIVSMLEEQRADGDGVAATARSEARRLFAREVVCAQISDALVALVERS